MTTDEVDTILWIKKPSDGNLLSPKMIIIIYLHLKCKLHRRIIIFCPVQREPTILFNYNFASVWFIIAFVAAAFTAPVNGWTKGKRVKRMWLFRSRCAARANRNKTKRMKPEWYSICCLPALALEQAIGTLFVSETPEHFSTLFKTCDKRNHMVPFSDFVFTLFLSQKSVKWINSASEPRMDGGPILSESAVVQRMNECFHRILGGRDRQWMDGITYTIWNEFTWIQVGKFCAGNLCLVFHLGYFLNWNSISSNVEVRMLCRIYWYICPCTGRSFDHFLFRSLTHKSSGPAEEQGTWLMISLITEPEIPAPRVLARTQHTISERWALWSCPISMLLCETTVTIAGRCKQIEIQ